LFQTKKTKDTISEESVIQQLQTILMKHEKNKEKTIISNIKNVEILMNKILNIREHARKKKDWETADSIRRDLQKLGFEIQDTKHGPIWRKKIEL